MRVNKFFQRSIHPFEVTFHAVVHQKMTMQKLAHPSIDKHNLQKQLPQEGPDERYRQS